MQTVQYWVEGRDVSAERLAAELAQRYPQLSVEVYQDGTRVNTWLTQVYDPQTKRTPSFGSRAAAWEALRMQPGEPSSSECGEWPGRDRSTDRGTSDDGGR